MLRDRQFFNILTWKCASRHSGVQFLISPLTTWLRTRRFNEPTFRLTRHTNHWKNTAFRDFSNIWRGWIFFLLTFALLHLLSSDSTSSSDFTFFWLYFIYLLFICFSTLHIVGSLLFKLHSTNGPAVDSIYWVLGYVTASFLRQHLKFKYYVQTCILPVVPHKAVAEVSRIGNYRRDWLLWVTDGRAKTLMDQIVQLCSWLTD